MSQVALRVGPQDHGRRLSLDDFETAEVEEGHLYELERGVLIASDIPGRRHFRQLDALRRQLYPYLFANPSQVHRIGEGGDCKLLVRNLESERHPDFAIYQTPCPGGRDFWERWIPEIVVEIVSPGGEERDYELKCEEYLAIGVKEYWVFDADRRELLVHRRRAGRWVRRVVRPGQLYQTRLLPGLEIDCAAVFDAASGAEEG